MRAISALMVGSGLWCASKTTVTQKARSRQEWQLRRHANCVCQGLRPAAESKAKYTAGEHQKLAPKATRASRVRRPGHGVGVIPAKAAPAVACARDASDLLILAPIQRRATSMDLFELLLLVVSALKIALPWQWQRLRAAASECAARRLPNLQCHCLSLCHQVTPTWLLRVCHQHPSSSGRV